MSELLTGITPQPDFPNEDLTEDNASLLEFMVANTQIRHNSHVIVDKESWSFYLGHPSILQSTDRVFNDHERHQLIDYGVISFEVITALINGKSRASNEQPAISAALTLRSFSQDDTSRYFEMAIDNFKQTVPNTADIITASVQNNYRHLANYALLGAAMSKRFGHESLLYN